MCMVWSNSIFAVQLRLYQKIYKSSLFQLEFEQKAATTKTKILPKAKKNQNFQ